jgi:hypothetical protein
VAQADHARVSPECPVVGQMVLAARRAEGRKPFYPNHFLTLEADRDLQAI